jgi:hypothetical protein
LIGNKSIKNNLLKYTSRNFLSSNVSDEDSNALFASFMDKSTNEDHSDYIHKLYKNLKKLRAGNRFPDVEVVDAKNKTANINTLIEKPTVIYFWSKAIKNHFKESHQRANELKKIYPDIHFMAININSNSNTVWKRLLRQHQFSTRDEYRFRDPEVAKKILAIHYINKVMIVDADGKILASNAMMFSNGFKDILDELSSTSVE